MFNYATFDAEQLNLEGQLSPAAVPGMFSFALDQDLTDQSGGLIINTVEPLDLDADDSMLSQLITPWPHAFDLVSGDITLASQLAWSKNTELALSVMLQLDDVGGYFNELVFSGLTLQHELDVLPVLKSREATEIGLGLK